ncbi:MAG: 16S rRNA (uracil(1498)-N(3))-methyltransferase [Pseudomonadota bacterium]
MKTAPRLYVTVDLPGPVPLSDGQTNYLKNVLRLAVGATVFVFNGRDGEFAATITALSKKTGTLEATRRVRAQTPAPTLTYAFAPPKFARLDYLVEKAAEMGAGALQPVMTQHTQMRRLNLARLQANVIEACEQCGILTVPPVHAAVDLHDLLAATGTLIVADEGLAGTPGAAIDDIRAAKPPLTVLVGPEGGFSIAERAAIQARAIRVGLGPRILRADTAAVALLALVEAAHPS